ncbi:MAG: hypothetical protein HZB55_14660 [Deltaproteobacteria bacterium]|nr:hypothetical protein [Deltaproteobacteria bacterium]
MGGGTGHALRGALIQQALWRRARRTSTLVVRQGSLPPGWRADGPVAETATGELDERLVSPGGALVVDTFPDGWMGRFSRHRQRSLFPRRVLVARAVFGGREPLPGTEDFDGLGVPYSAGADEWEVELPGAVALGFLLRRDPWRNKRVPKRLVVVDPSGRCAGEPLEVFRKVAALAGYDVSYQIRYGRVVAGSKVLFVGAGYHTFYEAVRQGADARFVALPKRYDDQAARAKRYGLLVSTPPELLRWLREEGAGPSCRPSGLDEDFEPAVVDLVLGREVS